MKLLLDENLSRSLVPFLQQVFPDSSQFVRLALESANDTQVWQAATDKCFVIVTRDADFEELSLVWGQSPPSHLAENPKSDACCNAENLAREPRSY